VEVASAIVRPGPRRSDVHRLRAAGPLRLMSPRAAGDAAWIVTSSLGGGLVDGDHVALEVTVDAGATAVVTTQASSKIYKGRSSQRLDVTVTGDGCVLVVPDPIVPYRDSTYAQQTRIVLAAESSLVLCDMVTAGRIAYGERWSCTALDLLLAIERAGSPLLHDRVTLGGAVADRMRRFAALATAVMIGPRVGAIGNSELAKLGQIAKHGRVVIAGSPLADGAIIRIAGDEIEEVVAATRELLRESCAKLGEDPWSRKW
jgi:urease accessory protein